MKKIALIIVVAWLAAAATAAPSRLDSLLRQIDNAIDNAQEYTARRQAQIAVCKDMLAASRGDIESTYRLNDVLFSMYRPFRYDSAAHYLDENIEIAKAIGDLTKLTDSRLKLSYFYASAGRYETAIDLLRLIDRHTLPSQFLPQYYSCYDHAYGEMVSYNVGGRALSQQYAQLSRAYKDSLYAVLDKSSDRYMSLEETRYRDGNNPDMALTINNERLRSLTPDSSRFATVMFQRALSYGVLADSVRQMECLAMSALSDIMLATKDHVSLWTLAQMLHHMGEYERANRYMRFSWDDTNFFNSPLRYWQSSGTQRTIENQFQDMIVDSNKRLKLMVTAIAALAALLLAALIFILKQRRKLTLAHAELKESNMKLHGLNQELSRLNGDLADANINLQESNSIKEVYISRFVKLCSEYIDKLDKFRIGINKCVSHGRIEDVKKMVRTDSMTDNELKVLYYNFDTAFLHIFPNFVEQFNGLLKEEERVTLASDELLNTELRIYALIRLGFNSSSQIAEILRYKVNTIYNYRAKVKNKAKDPLADFDELVRNLH